MMLEDNAGRMQYVGLTSHWTRSIFNLCCTVFEHMKNYNDLLEKVHGFLKPKGKLFVHIFTHKDYAYQFEE